MTRYPALAGRLDLEQLARSWGGSSKDIFGLTICWNRRPTFDFVEKLVSLEDLSLYLFSFSPPTTPSFLLSDLLEKCFTPKLTCGYMTSVRVTYGNPEGSLSPKVPEAWALVELYLVLCTNLHPTHPCLYLLHLVTRWVCGLFWVWLRVLLSWGQPVWRHQTGFTDGGSGPYGSYSHFEPNLSETLPGVDAPSHTPAWAFMWID